MGLKAHYCSTFPAATPVPLPPYPPLSHVAPLHTPPLTPPAQPATSAAARACPFSRTFILLRPSPPAPPAPPVASAHGPPIYGHHRRQPAHLPWPAMRISSPRRPLIAGEPPPTLPIKLVTGFVSICRPCWSSYSREGTRWPGSELTGWALPRFGVVPAFPANG